MVAETATHPPNNGAVSPEDTEGTCQGTPSMLSPRAGARPQTRESSVGHPRRPPGTADAAPLRTPRSARPTSPVHSEPRAPRPVRPTAAGAPEAGAPALCGPATSSLQQRGPTSRRNTVPLTLESWRTCPSGSHSKAGGALPPPLPRRPACARPAPHPLPELGHTGPGSPDRLDTHRPGHVPRRVLRSTRQRAGIHCRHPHGDKTLRERGGRRGGVRP